MSVSKQKVIQWTTAGISITDRQLNILIEIFSPTPVHHSYTLSNDGINQGKTRTFMANTDALNQTIYDYVNALTATQCDRLAELIDEWESISIKTMPLTEAERVTFRPGEPEEKRLLIKKRIQTYIPIFNEEEWTAFQMPGNIRLRG